MAKTSRVEGLGLITTEVGSRSPCAIMADGLKSVCMRITARILNESANGLAAMECSSQFAGMLGNFIAPLPTLKPRIFLGP